MEVILAIIAVVVVAGLVYKFVSIRKDTAVDELPTTYPEAAPYKVEPANQISMPVATKTVDKLEKLQALLNQLLHQIKLVRLKVLKSQLIHQLSQRKLKLVASNLYGHYRV